MEKFKNIALLDCETTGTDVYNSEMITAYVILYTNNTFVSDYYCKSQVKNWCKEAELIHNIPQNVMLTYPPKNVALGDFNNYLESLPSDTLFVMYANPNQMGEYIHFDKACIENEFMNADLPFRFKRFTSVYTMAKEAYQRKLFDPLVNPETGRKSFKQEMVYEALFDEKPTGCHEAKRDVENMKRIYDELKDMLSTGRKNKNKKQLDFDI